jgi:hypothetical protein
VVERLHAQGRVAAVVVDAHAGEHLPAVGQVWVVDLKDDAGVGNSLVLVVHRVCDGEEELFVVAIVMIEEPVLDGAGRNRRQISLCVAHTLHRRLDVLDIEGHLLLSDVGKRLDTEDGRVDPKRPPFAILQGSHATETAQVAREEAGELRQVTRANVARWRFLLGARLTQPAETGLDVEREPAPFAKLAIVDDVYPNIGLAFDNVPDQARHEELECGLVDALSTEHRAHDRFQLRRPRQCARV